MINVKEMPAETDPALEGHEKCLLAAQGYSELGMLDEALEELDTLPPKARKHPAALELRLLVRMQAHDWKAALKVSQELCHVAPDRSAGYIHSAFCLHELGHTAEAREVLLQGPEALHSEPTYHYNLACYECRLGNLDLARLHLEKSFALDKKFRDFAKSDPDLDKLRV